MTKTCVSSPASNGGSTVMAAGFPSSGTSLSLPVSQITSSTPFHLECFNNNISEFYSLSPGPTTYSTNTRESLDLFQCSAARLIREQQSKPSPIIGRTANHINFGAAQPTDEQHHTPDIKFKTNQERFFKSFTCIRDRSAGARVLWRRSLGSSPLTKEDVANQSTGSGSGLQPNEAACWPALEANYTYLMNCDLIESCRSINGEMSWDNGDLEHLRRINNETVATVPSPPVDVGHPSKGDEVPKPDSNMKLKLVRNWLKRVEGKVPKLIFRPKWSRKMLGRRTVEFKLLKREIESHASEIRAAVQHYASQNPGLSRYLENHYHRLLLRTMEWIYHLESLIEKLQNSEAKDVKGSLRNSNPDDSLDKELISSPYTAENSPGNTEESPLSVRKKLSFESDGDELKGENSMSSSKSWCQYSSSESDWLKSGRLELNEVSDVAVEPDDSHSSPSDSTSAELPTESTGQKAARFYDKAKLYRLVMEVEQMVSPSSSAGKSFCGSKIHKRNSHRYRIKADSTPYNHNTEFSSNCEPTSEGEVDSREAEHYSMSSDRGRKSASLNHTFMIPPCESLLAVAGISPVMLGTSSHNLTRLQRPKSLPALPVARLPTTTARLTASESALNDLLSSMWQSPPLATERSLPYYTPTQREMVEREERPVSSSCLADFSSCSGGSSGAEALQQRRRRHSSRYRNAKSNGQNLDLTPQFGSSDGIASHNATLQARLSTSAVSVSVESSAGSISRRNRHASKSSNLMRLSIKSNGSSSSISNSNAPVAVIGPMVIAPSSAIKRSTTPSTNTSSPRSTAPSDREYCLGLADDSSTVSDQAWDNYLDRYASEAYSEDPPDAESARRLLEFGEDYRNHLDSLSDCPSSLSAELRVHRPQRYQRSPAKRPKGLAGADRCTVTQKRSALVDSDSDIDDLVHVVSTSSSQLDIARNAFQKAVLSSHLDVTQYAELAATCHANLNCLRSILTQMKQTDNDLEGHATTVKDLIAKWELLDNEVAPILRDALQIRQLQLKVQRVKEKLQELESDIRAVGIDGDLQLNLNKIHHLRFQVEAEKGSLLQVNVDVHSCVMTHQPTDETTKAGSQLKLDVAGLYQTWELLLKNVMEKQLLLEEAEQVWMDIQRQLKDLKTDIAADQGKVQSLIDQQNGTAVSIQSTPDADADPSQISKWMEEWNKSAAQLGNIQCDSGISSGSDGEFISLGEREKRLSSLKQLARKLESALAPGNAALVRVNESLDQAQKDLTKLQKHLSQLPPIHRVSPEPGKILTVATKEASVQTDPPRSKKPASEQKCSATPNSFPAPDISSAPRSKLRHVWRIMKASLPFYFMFLVPTMTVYYYEPRSCLDTLGVSLFSKFNYLEGPRPI